MVVLETQHWRNTMYLATVSDDDFASIRGPVTRIFLRNVTGEEIDSTIAVPGSNIARTLAAKLLTDWSDISATDTITFEETETYYCRADFPIIK